MLNFKKIILVMLVAVLTVGFSGVSEGVNTIKNNETENHYFGDVDGDGQVIVGDAIRVLRHIVGLGKFEDRSDNWQRADVNLDGYINVGDAIMILRHVVVLIKEFTPISSPFVFTETALRYALGFAHVGTINLSYDITLDEPLEIGRNLTLDGGGRTIDGEVVVTSAVNSFTATDIQIDTLTLNGGGSDSVNLSGVVINRLNVNADVSINIEGNSSVGEVWVAKGIAPTFKGEDSPETVYYVATFTVKDSSNDPVIEAKVKVFADSSRENLLKELTTDSDGRAEEHFAEGTYYYSVNADGFKEYKDSFTISGRETSVAVEMELNYELDVAVQPAGSTAGAALDPAPEAAVSDASGGPVAGVDVKVSLNKGAFASGATTVKTDDNGLAVFEDLVLTAADTGYKLTFSADGLTSVDSEEFEVKPAVPANFALNVDVDVGSMQFIFSSFMDAFGNQIDMTEFAPDMENSSITLVAEGAGDDITVALAALPNFVLIDKTMSVTVATEEIVALGSGGGAYFDGLDMNVHTAVDARIVDADGKWEIPEITGELPVFPAEDLNDVFVGMVDDALLAVAGAMDDSNDLLDWQDVEIGPDHFERQPVNLNNARDAYHPVNALCEALEGVVLEDALSVQRGYLDGVKSSLEAVEGMLVDEMHIIRARDAVMPHLGGAVTPATIAAAKEKISNFEAAYGSLQINEPTDNHRDDIINDAKDHMRIEMNNAFKLAGVPAAAPGRFSIVAPWLDDVGDKVDFFRITCFYAAPDSGAAPTAVDLLWDADVEAYYLHAQPGETPGEGCIDIWLSAAGTADELACYFGVDREILVKGRYDTIGVTTGPLPVEHRPEDRAWDVRVDTDIKVIYNMNIEFTPPPSGAVVMKYRDPETENWTVMTVQCQITDNVLSIVPEEGLDYGTDYCVEITADLLRSLETEILCTEPLAWHFTTGVAMDIEPQEVYVRPFEGGGEASDDVEFNQTFTLTLNYGEFKEGLTGDDFTLDGIFADWPDADLAITLAQRDPEDTNRAQVTVEGYLNIGYDDWRGFEWDDGHYATGTITALETGHNYAGGDVSTAVVLREEPEPIWLDPGHLHVAVYDEDGPDVEISEQFRINLGFGTFVENLDETHFELGGIFAGGEGYHAALQVENVLVDPFNPAEASFTLSGILNISQEQWNEWHHHAEGNITVLPAGHTGDEPLTARIWVSPPPDPLRAHPDHIWVPVYDGENNVSFEETFELSLGFDEFDNLVPEDISLGGKFDALAVKEIQPQHPNCKFVTIEGNLNISHEDWLDHWGAGGEEYMIATITIRANGHTGDDDLDAEIHIYPQDLWRPAFSVDPQANRIWGNNWLPHEGLTIRVGDSVEPKYESTISADGWGFFHIEDEALSIEAGDIVIVTGTKIEKAHEVTALDITAVDIDNDIISGIAAPQSTVKVDIFVEGGPSPSRMAIADEDGNWVADFSEALGSEPWDGAHDLAPGDRGNAYQSDEDDDWTCIDWSVPDPFLEASLNYGEINGRDWPANTEINVTIKDEAETEIYNGNHWTDGWGNFNIRPWEMEGGTVQPGHTVIAAGGGCRVEYEIGYIDVTGFDVDNDKISGKAAPDAWVEVTVFISGRDFQEFPRRSVQADANGDWTADFSVGGEGEEPWAQPFDLEPGCQGFAEQRAEGGGVTRFDWRIPDPHFIIFPADGLLIGFDWPGGEETTQVTIKRDEEVIYDGAVSPDEFGGYFDINIDIQAGDFVTVSAGSVEKTHTVTSLTLTVDRETGEVSGTADHGIDMVLNLEEEDGFGGRVIIESHMIFPDSENQWSVEFGKVIGEQQTVYAIQFGSDGGSTAVRN